MFDIELEILNKKLYNKNKKFLYTILSIELIIV